MLCRQTRKLELADMIDGSGSNATPTFAASKIVEATLTEGLTPLKLVQLIYPRYDKVERAGGSVDELKSSRKEADGADESTYGDYWSNGDDEEGSASPNSSAHDDNHSSKADAAQTVAERSAAALYDWHSSPDSDLDVVAAQDEQAPVDILGGIGGSRSSGGPSGSGSQNIAIPAAWFANKVGCGVDIANTQNSSTAAAVSGNASRTGAVAEDMVDTLAQQDEIIMSVVRQLAGQNVVLRVAFSSLQQQQQVDEAVG